MKFVLKIGIIGYCILAYACNSKFVRNTAFDNDIAIDSGSKIVKVASDSSLKNRKREILTEPVSITIVFPHYKLIVNQFNLVGDWNVNHSFDYYGDTAKVKFHAEDSLWTFSAINDTIPLAIDNGYNGKRIEIIPQNKADRFQLSYSFKMSITKNNVTDTVFWSNMAPYKKIQDSLTYFFRIPRAVNSNEYAKKVKRELKLKDTSYIYQDGDYGEEIISGVIYNHKLCLIGDSNTIYIKVARFSGTKVKETNYIRIENQDPD